MDTQKINRKNLRTLKWSKTGPTSVSAEIDHGKFFIMQVKIISSHYYAYFDNKYSGLVALGTEFNTLEEATAACEAFE